MNITQEKKDDLNAVLKVTIDPSDYKDKYEDALRDTRKKVNMPGFRQGKVPMGMVKKMYGQSILADELNRILNQAIQEYLTKENLPVLGQPMPAQDAEQGDWDNPGTFEFKYELGLAPDFSVDFGKKDKFTRHTILVDDELIDKQIEDLTRRNGTLEAADKVGENDLVSGDFVELNEDGEIKEGGIMHQSSVALEFVDDKKATKPLVGKKVGDIVVVEPAKLARGESDLAAMLGVEKGQLEGVNDTFNFRIGEIKSMTKHEVNKELFDKVFTDGEVEDEKTFRDRIAQDLDRMFAADADRMFQRDLSEQLVEKLSLSLPDEFLKRYIQATAEKEITDEQVNAEYDNYSKGLQWQLIQNKIIKENEIKVEEEEVMGYTKGILANQYAQYGIPAPEDAELEESARKVLGNQEEARRIFDTLYDRKVMEYFKSNLNVEEKAVSYDDFVKLASNPQ